jgi:formiminotetrahydrofolate cyclodeaminase
MADESLQSFLDALASGNSTPGGGGAAALTGSQAAALLSMVLNFTVGREKYAAFEEEMQEYLRQSESHRAALLALVDEDAQAFDAVAATYSMPRKTDEEKAARTAAMQSALKGAAQVPYTIAEHCLSLLHMTRPIAEQGNPNVVSDAATAAHLAFAALLSALVNVNINLKFIKDEAFVAEWQPKVSHMQDNAQASYAAARIAASETLGVNV